MLRRQESEPLARTTWIDPVTGAHGYLVIHSLVSGMATGGTRMRAGCTLSEVEDLARGMATKTATFNLPVGGAKGGIDFDPKDPRAVEVLERFCALLPAMARRALGDCGGSRPPPTPHRRRVRQARP